MHQVVPARLVNVHSPFLWVAAPVAAGLPILPLPKELAFAAHTHAHFHTHYPLSLSSLPLLCSAEMRSTNGASRVHFSSSHTALTPSCRACLRHGDSTLSLRQHGIALQGGTHMPGMPVQAPCTNMPGMPGQAPCTNILPVLPSSRRSMRAGTPRWCSAPSSRILHVAVLASVWLRAGPAGARETCRV